MADISATLGMMDNALAGARPAAAGPADNPGPQKSSVDKTLDMMQAALDGKLPEVQKPYETTNESRVLNTEAGANSALASTLGAPVDLATWALNKGIHGVNAAADAAGLTHRNLSDVVTGAPAKPLINDIANPLGGSESIKSAMGLIHANPDNVVPQNAEERIFHGLGEGVGSALLLPLGVEAAAAGKVISPAAATIARSAVGAPDALNATINGAAGAGSVVAQDMVPEPYKPLAALGGGLIAGAPVVIAHGAAVGAKAALEGLRDHVTEAGREGKARATVAKEMQTSASDPSAAREALADNPHEIVPGSTGTTGQIASDQGLLGWEGSVRQQNPEAFNARAAEQNAARVEHLESVQPTGNATDLPAAVKAQRDAVDQRSQEIVDQLHSDHQAELAKLKEFQPNGSPADVAAHFRDQRDALDRATQTTVDRAETEAQAARDQIQSGRPEDVGANLRAPAQEARNAAKDRENALWKAVDPDGTLSVSMGAIQSAKKAIYGDMTKAGEAGLSPAEKSLTGVIEQYKPVESFKELTDLRSMVSSAMRAELKTSGRTPAFARMSQLRSSIENAIDSSVENRAVQEHGAVARGQIPQENAIEGRIRSWVNDFRARQSSEVSQPDGSAAAAAREPSSASVSGSKSQSGDGSGSPEGDQASAQLAPNIDAAARERLTAANEATKTRAATFDEGPAGKLLKPGARAGEYKISDAQAPAVVFHPGPAGGESVRGYLKASGPAGMPALNDAAAVSARNAAARPDGTLDPAKLTSWAQKHAPALAELPADVRGRFDNAAGAERAISEAMAARRDAIENFNKTSAAKVAGLSEDGDIVRHVGSILDKKDGAKQLGELAAAAKSNPAAVEGLKRAVVEDVFNRFLPEEKPAIDKLKSYVDERKDVLSKVFPEKDMAALSDQIAKAGEAGAKAEKGAQLRKAALDQFDKTILGKVMGLDAKRDIVDTIGGIFGKSDAAKQMETLARTAEKTPGGSDALKKAVTEYLQQKFTGTAEAGTTGTLEMNRANFLRFMREHTETLGKVLDDKQIGKLSAIVQDQLRANRSITATKLAGGSDTNQKQIGVAKLNAGTIISHLATEAVGKAAGAATGFLAGGGPIGAFLGAEGGSLGAKTMAALRDAGINRLNEIRVRAALDPEFGRAMLSEMPKKPDRDAAALIGLRARQWGVASAMAGARQ